MKSADINVIVSKYDSFLLNEGIDTADFDIDSDLAYLIYFKYVWPDFRKETPRTPRELRKFEKFIAKEINYTRLSLLRVKYFRNGNRAAGIKEGYVYIIRNKSWPTYYKIGSTINIASRLEQYQSYSPLRDYEMAESYFVSDRFSEESKYHAALGAKNEWIQTVFTNGKSSYQAMVKHFNSLRMKDYHSNIERIRDNLHR